jgi:hypothetical protein
MMTEDYVSGAEFGRFLQDFSRFQDRLERRLNDGFGGMNARLDDLNGRTRKNSEAIAAAVVRLDAIENEDSEIERAVANIRDHGCSQLESHATVMRAVANGGDGDGDLLSGYWPRKKKIAVGGGLLALGGVIGTLLLEMIKAAHHALDLTRPLIK